MTRIAREVKVRGLVQGVFFRATMMEVAQKHRVTGWVRNAGDGSVEAHLEGEERSVEEVIQWAKRGPSRARVDTVEVAESGLRNLRKFEVAG